MTCARLSSLRIALFAPLLILAGTFRPLLAQDQKPTVPVADYGKWESLGPGNLSPKGDWLAVPIRRVNGNNVLRIHRVGSDSVVIIENGDRAIFSKDGRWAAFAIGVSEETRERLQKEKKPIHQSLGLLDLMHGDTTLVPEVTGFAFSGDGRYLAFERYAANGARGHGADLLVRDLSTGRDVHFGSVTDFGWSDLGARLAFVVAGQNDVGAGVQLYQPASATLRPLASGAPVYGELTWRKKADDLAALAAVKDSGYTDTTHLVLAWRQVSRSAPQALEFDPARASGFPDSTGIVATRAPRWSDDGSRIFFGIKKREAKPAKEKKERPDSTAADTTRAGKARADSTRKAAKPDTTKPGLEIWHAKDVDIVPEQKVRQNINERRSDLAAWTLAGNRFARLTDGPDENAIFDAHASAVMVTDAKPYRHERMFGPNEQDLYVVNPATGERTRAATGIQYFRGLSPNGSYALWVDSADYWSYDLRSGKAVDLTKGLGPAFVNTEDDHPMVEKPPYGSGGWLKDDAAVLLYDKYDVWRVRPDGSGAQRLTRGAEDSVQYRVVRLDREEPTIDPRKPIYLATYGEWTKQYGYSRLEGSRVRRLVFEPKAVFGLIKADSAQVYAYTAQDFDDSPDYFVGGATLAGAHQVTHTNPFQKDYAWGRSELVEYHNDQGRRLQGALFYPANYDSTKTYPMITYIYEIRSPSVHQYLAPSERNYYNWTVFTQEGYFVFQPDIVYPLKRSPGLSAVGAIVPAVKSVLDRGHVDPRRVGLVGHSWGGYQTAFTVTQTDIFAAAVAGAPLTDLFSMYLSIYWNSGGTDARIFEISQGRMGVPFWEDIAQYQANSPVFHIDKLNTPLLVEDGTQDGAVDFNQAVEMYNAARRAQKDFVLLVYLGQNHGLSDKTDQIDYHRRILEWFGHYLKGEPAGDWITKGVPYLIQKKEFSTSPPGSPRRDDGR